MSMMRQPSRLAPIDVARVCHEAHRALCAVLGNDVVPPWPDAPDWLHASTVEAVEWLQGQCGETAAGLHSRWMRRMVSMGWTDGPVYDEAAKTHPRLWPWAQQAPAQQIKDELFVAIVRTLGMMGWWDRRVPDTRPSDRDIAVAAGLPENPGMVPL